MTLTIIIKYLCNKAINQKTLHNRIQVYSLIVHAPNAPKKLDIFTAFIFLCGIVIAFLAQLAIKKLLMNLDLD
jgi:hypothetical protein